MIRSAWMPALILILSGPAYAKDPPPPCRTKSRQMTLIKNCYTGDMLKPIDGSGQFFGSADAGPAVAGVSYCYNSLVMVEHKNNEPTVLIHILRDAKDGKFIAYNYSLANEEIKKIKKDTPTFELKGLKGFCFSAKGDKEVCSGGLLKAIGWKDTDVPMVVALGKAAGGQYTVSHLVYDPKELDAHKAKELELTPDQDLSKVNQKLLQEVRRKLLTIAKSKMASMRSAGMTPQKLSASSEQFRFCSMALDGFLKAEKLSDPFSPDEKMSLATLTNYMNNDPNLGGPEPTNRMPASTASSKTRPANRK